MGGKPVLYDVPVSNNGARCRIIIYKKGIEDQISIKSPQDIGGLKSAEYLKLNPQGKMPLLVADDIVLPESDTISRYLLDRFSNSAPSFVPTTLAARGRSDLLCRLHDMYEPSSSRLLPVFFRTYTYALSTRTHSYVTRIDYYRAFGVCVFASSHAHRYLTTIQGALYKATPPFGVYTARVDALRELRKQLHVLNDAADPAGPYLAVRAV